jgi:hypothetical protein
MNDRPTPGTQPDPDPETARLAREHPGWQIWRGGISGTYYALAADTAVAVRAETVADLADKIRRAER